MCCESLRLLDHVSSPQEAKEANSLSYRNVGPGQVLVSWTYPDTIASKIAGQQSNRKKMHSGATVSYTDNKVLPLSQWRRISIDDPKKVRLQIEWMMRVKTEVVLAHLREGTRYHVRIVPRLVSGEHDLGSGEAFELKTDHRRFTADRKALAGEPALTPVSLAPPARVPYMQRAHPLVRHEPLQHLEAHPTKEHMRIVSCLPDAIVVSALCHVSVRVRKLGEPVPSGLQEQRSRAAKDLVNSQRRGLDGRLTSSASKTEFSIC